VHAGRRPQFETSIESTANLTASDEPAKIIWDFPSGLQQVILPFEFKNIPLP
jgi:hypothetical protein